MFSSSMPTCLTRVVRSRLCRNSRSSRMRGLRSSTGFRPELPRSTVKSADVIREIQNPGDSEAVGFVRDAVLRQKAPECVDSIEPSPHLVVQQDEGEGCYTVDRDTDPVLTALGRGLHES